MAFKLGIIGVVFISLVSLTPWGYGRPLDWEVPLTLPAIVQPETSYGESFRTFSLAKPIHVYVNTKSPLFKPHYARMVEDSLYQWSQAVDGRLKFKFVSQRSQGDIVIDWVPQFYDRAQAGETEFQEGHAEVVVQAANLPDNIIHGTIMHELGHALGIAEHSSGRTDVMSTNRAWQSYEEYRNYRPHVSQNDSRALRHLYSVAWNPGDNLYALSRGPQQETVATLQPGDTGRYQRYQAVSYSGYLEHLNMKIQREWQVNGSHSAEAIVIRLVVKPDGSLAQYNLVSSSGNPATDALALKSVKAAFPFQPFPSNMDKPSMQVEVTLF